MGVESLALPSTGSLLPPNRPMPNAATTAKVVDNAIQITERGSSMKYYVCRFRFWSEVRKCREPRLGGSRCNSSGSSGWSLVAGWQVELFPGLY